MTWMICITWTGCLHFGRQHVEALASDDAAPGVPFSGPLYKEVKRQITESLTRGEWKPGEAIPAERTLSERYGISIGTIRSAIDELVAENILIRQQGRGTFVASHNRDRMLFYFFHIVDDDGHEALSGRRAPGVRARQGRSHRGGAPRPRAGDGVFRIRNRLTPRRRARHRSTTSRCRWRVSRTHRAAVPRRARRRSTTCTRRRSASPSCATSERLRAIVADAETAALLSIARNTPLLRIRRVAFTYNDAPIELRVSLVDTTRNEYFADIGKPA